MNREIKFRAWDESTKTMRYPNDSFDRFHTEKYNSGQLLKSFDCVMQYTGLKDKNGKEIYEGDIIASKVAGVTVSVGDVQFSHGVFGIEWVHAKKTKSMVGGWGQLHNLRTMDDDILQGYEIIGNIHENANLINS